MGKTITKIKDDVIEVVETTSTTTVQHLQKKSLENQRVTLSDQIVEIDAYLAEFTK